MTIRARLALGVALTTALVVLMVAAVQFLALRSFLSLAEKERLETLLPVLASTLDSQLTGRGPLDGASRQEVARSLCPASPST